MMLEPQDLLDSWRVNNAICLELLDLCPDEAFAFKPGKGKTIRSNFVHIIGVRRMWLEDKLPKKASEIPKLDWKAASREQIVDALNLSSQLILEMLEARMNSTKVTRFSPMLFLSYAIAHEAHHRSQIEIALRINGAEPEDAKLYNLWEWSKKT